MLLLILVELHNFSQRFLRQDLLNYRLYGLGTVFKRLDFDERDLLSD